MKYKPSQLNCAPRVSDIPDLIDMDSIAGFQILPHLDGHDFYDTVYLRAIYKDKYSIVHQVYVEKDALAFNLTIKDFKDFNDFAAFIDRWFPGISTQLSLIDIYKDYLYYKNLEEE
jgi:hypothetical protein